MHQLEIANEEIALAVCSRELSLLLAVYQYKVLVQFFLMQKQVEGKNINKNRGWFKLNTDIKDWRLVCKLQLQVTWCYSLEYR